MEESAESVSSYAAIGLATGGKPVSEKRSTRGADALASAEPAETPAQSNSTQEPVASSSQSKDIPKGYARIIRDDQGNVVRIEEAEDEDAGDTLPAGATQRLDLFDEEEEEAQVGTEDAPKTDVVRGEQTLRCWTDGGRIGSSVVANSGAYSIGRTSE